MKNETNMAIMVVTVKIYIGTGCYIVDARGAPLSTSLAKKLPRPKAVADFSTSKMRAFAAMKRMYTPATPNLQMRKMTGNAIESVFCRPKVSMRTPPMPAIV